MEVQIRKAKEQDIEEILKLLKQVLELHASLRPDLFISGTTKYTKEEVKEILGNENTPVFVAVDEMDKVQGYAFCIMEYTQGCTNQKDRKTLYIDDLCVDETLHGKHIGKALYTFVVEYAKKMNCNDVTLHVWEGNTKARSFYEAMGMKIRKTQMEVSLEK